MRKTRFVYLLCALCALIVLASIIVMIFIKHNTRVETFSVQDYQCIIESFPSDRCTKEITNDKDAIAEAEHIWVEIYGDTVLDDKPYVAYYDPQNDMWLIRGTVPPGFFGGVPFAIIRSDGQVIAVWHDK